MHPPIDHIDAHGRRYVLVCIGATTNTGTHARVVSLDIRNDEEAENFRIKHDVNGVVCCGASHHTANGAYRS
jgi:hypothetical protein